MYGTTLLGIRYALTIISCPAVSSTLWMRCLIPLLSAAALVLCAPGPRDGHYRGSAERATVCMGGAARRHTERERLELPTRPGPDTQRGGARRGEGQVHTHSTVGCTCVVVS